MKTFKEFPEDQECPICNTAENRECCLIPILETREGNLYQAAVVHLDCLLDNLVMSRTYGAILTSIHPEGGKANEN